MDYTSEDPSNVCISVMIVGASGTGKTSALMKYLQESFYAKPPRTLAVDCWTTSIMFESKVINLKIYDTPGTEEFSSTIAAYWYRVNAIIFCVSVDLSSSIQFIRDICNKYSSLYSHDKPAPLYSIAVMKSEIPLDSQFESSISELARWAKVLQESIYKVSSKSPLSAKHMIDGVICIILSKHLYSYSHPRISTKSYIKAYSKSKAPKCKCEII
jgi:GTPase SAR1 family protein